MVPSIAVPAILVKNNKWKNGMALVHTALKIEFWAIINTGGVARAINRHKLPASATMTRCM